MGSVVYGVGTIFGSGYARELTLFTIEPSFICGTIGVYFGDVGPGHWLHQLWTFFRGRDYIFCTVIVGGTFGGLCKTEGAGEWQVCQVVVERGIDFPRRVSGRAICGTKGFTIP